MARKFKNKNLPRGVYIDRGYVFLRLFPNGREFRTCVGPVTEHGIIDVAIAKLGEYREKIRTNKFDLEEKSFRLTMEQACDVYHELHGSKKKSWRDNQRITRLLKSFWTGRFIDTITYIDVQNFRDWRAKSVSPSSVNREHTVITNLFNKLKEWRRIKAIREVRLPSENPGSEVRKASERPYVRKRVLTIEEFERLIENATPRVRRICLGAINTTLRLKDLKLMTKDNVEISNNQLEGQQAKTNKPYTLPINSVMARLIETASDHHIFDFSNFRKEFEAAVKAANIKGFQFRDLRRTGATILLKKGMDIATVSTILGHTSIQMTERYLHTSKEDKQKAVNILGDLFDGMVADAPRRFETDVKTDVRAKIGAAVFSIKRTVK